MRRKVVLLLMLCVVGLAGTSSADDVALKQELEMLKQRVLQLETQLKGQEVKQSSASQTTADDEGVPIRGGEMKAIEKSIKDQGDNRPAQTPQAETAPGVPVRGEEVKTIKDTIMERLGTLSIHGGVVGYYQGRNGPTINDIDYKGANGAGFAADLELSFNPLESGEFLMRVHAGEGNGADKGLADDGALFANLNTIADDNPGSDGLSLLEAFYTQTFCHERYLFAIGKTEQVVFIDDNAFANDEYTQFVGKPFVNNPMLDSEDEYGPLMAAQISPWEQLAVTFLYSSSSRPNAAEDTQKSVWDDIFDTPFLGGQLTFSPKIFGFDGNYRVYGWGATYQHDKISGNGKAEGWGIGLSFDQMVHEKVGLFARFGYSSEEVYQAPWFWSAGVNLKGLIPSRDEDEIGLGVAGLEANSDLGYNGTELHLEAYYRIVLSEYFSISPDIQFVANPLGNNSNQNIVAGMLKGQFSF